MGQRTCIKYENFDFELLNTTGLKGHCSRSSPDHLFLCAPFSYDGKKAFVMMRGCFYHQNYYFNGKVRHRINIIIDDDSKLDFFHKLNHRIKQFIGSGYLIYNRHGRVGLITYFGNIGNKSVICKFKKRVNGKLKWILPQDMERCAFEGACVFRIYDLFEAHNKHVRLIAHEFLLEEFESSSSDEEIFD